MQCKGDDMLYEKDDKTSVFLYTREHDSPYSELTERSTYQANGEVSGNDRGLIIQKGICTEIIIKLITFIRFIV